MNEKAAARYIDRGWLPLPIPSGRKAPTVDTWQTFRFAPEHFEGGNVGVHLGPSGLVDIDLDCAEAIELAPTFLPPTATFGRTSKPRSHYLYRGEAAYRKFVDPIDRKCILEIRAGKGKQTVFPPSLHPSGEAIAWDQGDEPAELSDLVSVAHLAAAAWCKKHPDQVETAPPIVEGWARGEVPDTAAGEGADPRPVAVFYEGRDPQLIEAIVTCCPEKSRHDYRLAVAGAMKRGGVAEHAASDMLSAAMSDVRLGDDRSDAEKDARAAVRDTFSTSRAYTGAGRLIELGGRDVVKRIEDLTAPGIPGPDPAATRGGLSRITCAQIFEPLPPVEWLIEGLDICPGAVHMLAGYGYSGKTMAAQSLALAVASGHPVWGAFSTRAGKVLHLDYEQGRRLTLNRYQRLAHGVGVDPTGLGDGLSVICSPPVSLTTSGVEDVLKRECEGHALLLVDSLRAATPGVEENSSEIRAYLDLLSRVSDETGCSVLVIHHARKSDGEHGKMAIRGSGAIFDACASVLVFQADRGDKVTSVRHEKARTSGTPAQDFALEIRDVPDGPDPRMGLAVTTAAPITRLEGAEDRVVQALRGAPDGTFASLNSLIAATGSRKGDVVAAVDELVLKGLIWVDETGRRGAKKICLRTG